MNFELLKTLTILYIEDETSLQEDICQNIAPFVKEIIRGNDGNEGLDLFMTYRAKIDLIISDILMPKMNGIEMIDAIRGVDSEIPVIYTTAFNDSEYMKLTIEQSIVSYILKPIDIELLLNGIIKASIKIENEKLKTTLKEINQELEVKVDLKTKELKIQNEKLYKQLFTDELTSLFNRKALLRDIAEANNPILSIVDIDAFKGINDLYGELIGNKVLIKVANLLKDLGEERGCRVYRIGSDEFVLLKDQEFQIEKCIETINLVIKGINTKPIHIQEYDMSLRIDVTIGISKEKTNTLETAGMALKIAKNDKLSHLIYCEKCNLYKEYENDIKWTKIIAKAIENDSVTSYYQPIVDKDENIVKYESLMRIVENDTIHLPFLFLDISKKVKFYAQLEQTVITKVFKKAKETGMHISINLSIEDILNVELIKFIEKELVANGIAHLITFELLENESITDYDNAIDFINMVQNLGSTIAIDDFGSGYSNFEYLLRLKPDYIKIDGSCIKNIHNDKNAYLITKTINDFAHNLGIKTIAEFVHNKEVFDVLKGLGIDEYQGHYFSEPVDNF
ncbi:MAG: EAL domain-containing protein [Candidatus Hydrogenedentes bacterium]|nr:EAL domain-containing protein [Candidatus Hydrogenedentota bacterium]